MGVQEAIRTTIVEIWAHKLRSGLTLLGVILGTTGVVVMLTMIEGVKVMAYNGIRGIGFDGVMFISSRTPEDTFEADRIRLSHGLDRSDVELLAGAQSVIDEVTAVRMTDRIVEWNSNQERVRILGVSRSYRDVHGRGLKFGRWFCVADESGSSRVAILGSKLAAHLFGDVDPTGSDLHVGETIFRVIGVESTIGNRFTNGGWGADEMDSIIVPVSTYSKFIQGGDQVSLITIRTSHLDNLDIVQEFVERTIRRAHNGISDFKVENVAVEMLKAEKQLRELMRNWTIVMVAISGLSLLVGGIGIYSVMKISLAERVYEIGLRKAIGAYDTVILLQVLIESTTLSIIGAVLGCGIGSVVTYAASTAFDTGLTLSPLGIALGIAFAVGVGLFAGVFPAHAASRLTPIDALRKY